MKKFLGKKGVMIALWAVTAILAALMIGMAVRPVSYGWAYTGSASAEMIGLTEDMDMELVFDEKEIEIHAELDSISMDMGMWYLRDGREFVGYSFSYVPPIVAGELGNAVVTEDVFDQAVRDLKADKQMYKNVFANASTINAFKCDLNGEEFICTTAIVFTVVCGVFVAATLTLSVLSTKAFVKGKKEEPKTEETAA